MAVQRYLGIDCGSVSLNLVLLDDEGSEPVSIYRRTRGRPLQAFMAAADELAQAAGGDVLSDSTLVTGSGRELLSQSLRIPAINEITAHATAVYRVNPAVRTIIEIGGQDSKFIRMEPPLRGDNPQVPVFRMNEICAAGTGAFLDEQAERLGIPVESLGTLALQSGTPAAIAGRCAVFAKTDMIHQAQEGTPLSDILLGLAFALARNFVATLIRGEDLKPPVSLQGGVMLNRAVVHAFRRVLGLAEDQVIIPPHFTVLGALGCAVLSRRKRFDSPVSLTELKERARQALETPRARSFFPPLNPELKEQAPPLPSFHDGESFQPPFIMGVDVGSVSVKGVLINRCGHIVKHDYRLSHSKVLDAVADVTRALCGDKLVPAAIAVTGSGRYLAGRLLEADLIVNEITAQAEAALSHAPDADTIVEIGGQDSKWIALENGTVRDFEMNRVCAAGTGSFLMAQAQRLDLDMGRDFSDAAFASETPADLGTRCTVFMESDLIHHQNNGAPSEDLAGGVCISIVHNYLERVANHKPLGDKVLFLGGVAATPAVRAAFEQQTGRRFQTPPFHHVSGALGAALNLHGKVVSGEITPRRRTAICFAPETIRRKQFTCEGCANQCRVSRYRTQDRIVFHGGLCDRWETEEPSRTGERGPDLFAARVELLDHMCESDIARAQSPWGMVRAPQFYEWFPFWNGYCRELGIGLTVAPRPTRDQFEAGSRFLRVETCLPMKVMAGQIQALVKSGVTTLFHPTILNERPLDPGKKAREHCPYIQASSQFFRGVFDVEWKELFVSFALDPHSLHREHLRFAQALGFSQKAAAAAIRSGLEELEDFNARLRTKGEDFVNSLGLDERALVVLGKPYHTSETFLNMNLGSLFKRLGVRAIPSDLYPLSDSNDAAEVAWKYQGDMLRVAREISRDSRLFPLMITFFGCGPDPFTLRHLRSALGGKPLLVLEMDEHASRAGLMTRIEAFLEQIGEGKRNATGTKKAEKRSKDHLSTGRSDSRFSKSPEAEAVTAAHENCLPVESERSHRRLAGAGIVGVFGGGSGRTFFAQKRSSRGFAASLAKKLYLPYMCEHAYGFAAAARSVDIDAQVLPQPDEESERLGRPHLVGGECHPYALLLGDYLKLARTELARSSDRSLFYIIGPDACRLGQFPRYIDRVRTGLGLSVGVAWDVNQGLAAFGLSSRNCRRVLVRAWEGLYAYDVLLRVYHQIRPVAADKVFLDGVYVQCREKLFDALCAGRVRQGMEEIVHDLGNVPLGDPSPRPVVAVTGDYYTRVVPFANNDVYEEIEALGGTIWTPPVFTDCLKLGIARDMAWGFRNGRLRAGVEEGLLYLFLAISEFRVKGSRILRRRLSGPLDLSGLRMWKSASSQVHTRLPAGITAPIATALHQLERGADGVLNLMTLNCSYGTVVTAALSRAIKEKPGIPMLTLVFDGLKKTNEKTRLEAFMEQVRDYFKCRAA